MTPRELRATLDRLDLSAVAFVGTEFVLRPPRRLARPAKHPQRRVFGIYPGRHSHDVSPGHLYDTPGRREAATRHPPIIAACGEREKGISRPDCPRCSALWTHSPSGTQAGSRVPELGSLGSVRKALSNERPYRDLWST